MIVGMNHFTVIAEDAAQTLDFYVGVLGLKVGHRPDLGFPGAWLYADCPQAIVHVYFDRPVPSQRAGVIDHMAFTATDLKAVKARFDERGLKYDLRRQAGAGTWQLFSYDPNGAKVELEPAQLVWGAKRIVGVIMYDPWVIPRALDFLVRNRARWPFDRLVSHTYPLERIDAAFADAEWRGRETTITRAALAP